MVFAIVLITEKHTSELKIMRKSAQHRKGVANTHTHTHTHTHSYRTPYETKRIETLAIHTENLLQCVSQEFQ